MEHIKLYIDFLGVSYKITNVVIKNIVFIILIKSKYHIPIAKEHNNITVIIDTLNYKCNNPIPLSIPTNICHKGRNQCYSIPY